MPCLPACLLPLHTTTYLPTDEVRNQKKSLGGGDVRTMWSFWVITNRRIKNSTAIAIAAMIYWNYSPASVALGWLSHHTRRPSSTFLQQIRSRHSSGLKSGSCKGMSVMGTACTNVGSTSSSSPLESYDEINRRNGMAKEYDPKSFESAIYQWWEESKAFSPSHNPASHKTPYVIPMPPPNVTGRLHMGHAIFVAIQDVLARFHRMRGRPVLWLPGTDHAGIATQLQVEKQIQEREGYSAKNTLSREDFLQRIWNYKEEQGGYITNQLRVLGASADWSRERFTMDPQMSQAVIEAFVRLHDQGLIYRGEYMVNWAPGLQTAVSDLEVEYTEEEGSLYYFKYLLADADHKESYIPVATTRPETIFGDTAVCVHPDDERYRNFIGKQVLVPMSGGRTVPVITDEYVDREFGTGALKITPAHDPNDYSLGKKHNLHMINIMNKDGSLNAQVPPTYQGLDRFVAREQLWNDMSAAGLAISVKQPHLQRIPRSQRGGEIIEPLISKQWFVRTQDMGGKALHAVESGDIKILPPRFEKIWYNWLTDIHDWCISRQLIWGHRIPVWYINNGSEYVVARNEHEAREIAWKQRGYSEDVILTQDEDVLDTWFSSGLWPFATVGWPSENAQDEDSDLAKFYPATCLETGYDILFFWVARMVMLGLQLTGKSPFSVIYLHGLVRAADGTKMSKTKGNVIDPLDTVTTYGADSLRYSLVTGVTPGQDIPLNMDKVEANRNFANKLWNCCKFVTENALKGADDEEYASLGVSSALAEEEYKTLPLPERYIVSKCHALVQSVTEDLENYSLGAAGSKVYEFLWDEFADWYIEISKTRLYEGAGGGGLEEAKVARRVLVYILDISLKLLHPYMPYVTEQLWHHLPRPHKKREGASSTSTTAHALMLASWPQLEEDAPLAQDPRDIKTFETFQALTRSIRNARAEYNVEQGKRIRATIVISSGPLKDEIEKELKSLVVLCRLDPHDSVVCEEGSEEAKAAAEVESVRLVVQDDIVVILPLSGLIDPVKERQRLQKQVEKLEKEIEKLSARLNSKGFVDKAPTHLVAKAREELMLLESQAAKVRSNLKSIL